MVISRECAARRGDHERKTKTQLALSSTEREQLIALTKRRKTAQALALRARIALACAEGLDNKVVAARLRVTQQMVSKRRGRFVELRMEGLLDALRLRSAHD